MRQHASAQPLLFPSGAQPRPPPSQGVWSVVPATALAQVSRERDSGSFDFVLMGKGSGEG